MKQPVFVQYVSSDDNEIDLIDIFRFFVRYKWLIAGITLGCTVLAVMITLVLPQEYKAEIRMMPPSLEMVEKLNVPNIGGAENEADYFFSVKPQDLYHEFINNLQSYKLQRRFFNKNNLLSLLKDPADKRSDELIFREEFRNKLSFANLKKNKKDTFEFIELSLQGKDIKNIADWLNQFVQLADRETILTVQQSFSRKAQRRKENISKKIKSLRAIEKARRMDRIAQLEEAYRIAQGLGWQDGRGYTNVPKGSIKGDDKGVSMPLVDMQNAPLYLRGTKALGVEISILQQRKNDDPFIPQLRNLQETLSFLNFIGQDTDNVHSMRLDQPAVADDRPVKPKRGLIVALGFVFGAIFSIFFVLVRNLFVRTKKDASKLIPD